MSRRQATLLDIIHAGKSAMQFTEGLDREAFMKDFKTQSAVCHQFMLMGEAVKRLSQNFRDRHSEVPWRHIAWMRDVLIHAYESVDMQEVWNTVQQDLPVLMERIEPLFEQE